jgi:hypothetical protein
MARDRVAARCVNSCGQAAKGRECAVSYRVDTGVQDVQTAGGDPAVDCARMHPQVDELPARNHAVLPIGKRRNRGIKSTR